MACVAAFNGADPSGEVVEAAMNANKNFKAEIKAQAKKERADQKEIKAKAKAEKEAKEEHRAATHASTAKENWDFQVAERKKVTL